MLGCGNDNPVLFLRSYQARNESFDATLSSKAKISEDNWQNADRIAEKDLNALKEKVSHLSERLVGIYKQLSKAHTTSECSRLYKLITSIDCMLISAESSNLRDSGDQSNSVVASTNNLLSSFSYCLDCLDDEQLFKFFEKSSSVIKITKLFKKIKRSIDRME